MGWSSWASALVYQSGDTHSLFQIAFIGDSNADIFSAVTQTVFGGVITESLYNQQSNLNSLVPIGNDQS